jgi:hypothetical protein
VGDATPIDIVLLDSLGNPVFGFDPSRPDTAALTQPVVNTTSSVIVAANPARRQFIIQNTTGKNILLAFAATASATAYTQKIPNGGSYESTLNGYTGDVTAITDSGSGTARVTEITT